MATRLEQILVKMGFDVSESSKVNDAMNKVKEGAHKAGEGVEGFNTHGREMHELIHKIGAQSPLLGSALKAAFNPEAAGIALFIGALEFVKSRFEKISEKIKELTDNLNEMWDVERRAAIEAQYAIKEFQEKINDILDSSKDRVKEENKEFERQLGLIKEIYGGHGKVMSALNESADADLKRKRTKEDRELKTQEESALTRAGKNEPAKEAVRKRFELEKQAIDDRREYEDAVIKAQREKQAENDARLAEQAAKKVVDTRKDALQKEFDAAKAKAEESAKLADKDKTTKATQAEEFALKAKALQKDIDDAAAKAEAAKSGFWAGLGRSGESLAHAINPTQMGGPESLESLDKKEKDLRDEQTKALEERAKIEREIKEGEKSANKDAADLNAKKDELNSILARQRDLNNEITVNEDRRRKVGAIHDQELKKMQAGLGQGLADNSNQPSWITGQTGDFSLTGQAGRDFAARHSGIPVTVKPEQKADDPALTAVDKLEAIRKLLSGEDGGNA